MENSSENNHNKRNKVLLLLTSLFLFIGIGYFVYWLEWGRFHQFTDDAYVNGNAITITPFVPGIVTKVYVQDTDYVTKGTPLVELDKIDYQIALDKSVEDLAQTVRSIAELFAKAHELEAQIEVKKAAFIKASQDYEYRVPLVGTGAISKEDFTHATSALASTYFSLVAVDQQLIGILAQIENTQIETHPLVNQAKEMVKRAYVNLCRCTLHAPVSGLIAQKGVQVGAWVKPEESLLAVVPLDQMWVDANYKETQLTRMRLGQRATLVADIYGSSVIFHGVVTGIAGGTGSIFSVLPPQNATGNWIKIVQRLPVRIDIDPMEIKKHPLRMGLSMEVVVDVHDKDAPALPQQGIEKPRFVTDIFEGEEQGVDELIQSVLQANLSSFTAELETFVQDGSETP